MIAITGDIHGGRALLRLKPENIMNQLTTLPSELIVLGDFGLIWEQYPDTTEFEWISYLDSLPYRILSILGNHENFERIYALPVEEIYGAPAYKVTQNIYFLQHGNQYVIDGKSLFVFGGATSIDKHLRINRLSWWQEEIPDRHDFMRALQTIDKNEGKFDFVLTHTAPREIIRQYYDELGRDYEIFKDPTQEMLDILRPKLEFQGWYFGHFHGDSTIVHNGEVFRML